MPYLKQRRAPPLPIAARSLAVIGDRLAVHSYRHALVRVIASAQLACGRRSPFS